MNTVVGTNKRADALTNRARLLEAARTVFVEAGLDLEVNDVIARAQLGVGTFYRHFGTREDLLRAIVIQAVEDAQVQIRQAIAPHTDDSRAALQALVGAQLQVYQQHQLLFAAMRDRRLTRLFDPVQREALHTLVLDPARQVIERGILAGVFRHDLNRDLAAAMTIGAFTSIFDLLGDHHRFDELEQQIFQLLWTMFAHT